MVDSINTTLDCRPQSLTSVDVGNPTNILLCSVLHDFVGISESLNVVVTAKLVCEDNSFVVLSDSLFNHRKQSPSLDIRDNLSDCVPVTLNHAHDYRFPRCSTTTLASPLSTNVSFVNFNLATEGINIFSHQLAGLGKDAPCCLICDSKLPLKLFGGNTSLCCGHQKQGMKPRTEWSIRLLINSASGRRYMGSAKLTRINLALGYAIVCSNLLALWEIDSVRPSNLFEQVKANIIIGKLLVKVFRDYPLTSCKGGS